MTKADKVGAVILAVIVFAVAWIFTNTIAEAAKLTGAVLLGVIAFFGAIWLLTKATELLIAGAVLLYRLFQGKPPT